MSGRLLDLARRAREEEHPCLSCGTAADELTLFCPSCWTRRRGPRRLTVADEERAARTAATMMEAYCGTCGFSVWRVSSRGDASCYACSLLAAGKPLRCARCGGEEWRRDEHGRAACSTCAEGDTRVAPPSAIVSPESTSRLFSDGGAA